MSERPEATTRPASEQGHEPTTLSGGRVAMWGAALAGLIAIALLVTWSLWRALQVSGPVKATPLAAATAETGDAPTARVTLNPNQPATRRQYQRKQESLLREYAWVDRQQETARIPIERAMQIIVERASEE